MQSIGYDRILTWLKVSRSGTIGALIHLAANLAAYPETKAVRASSCNNASHKGGSSAKHTSQSLRVACILEGNILLQGPKTSSKLAVLRKTNSQEKEHRSKGRVADHRRPRGLPRELAQEAPRHAGARRDARAPPRAVPPPELRDAGVVHGAGGGRDGAAGRGGEDRAAGTAVDFRRHYVNKTV